MMQGKQANKWELREGEKERIDVERKCQVMLKVPGRKIENGTSEEWGIFHRKPLNFFSTLWSKPPLFSLFVLVLCGSFESAQSQQRGQKNARICLFQHFSLWKKVISLFCFRLQAKFLHFFAYANNH